MPSKNPTERKTIRVAGKLKEIVTVKDSTGKIIHSFVNPIMVEFYARDLMQIIIGASILAIPVSFTEEVWNLGKTLPLINVLMISFLSLIFISAFVYYNFYKNRLKGNEFELVKRVVSIYIVSMAVVGVLLTIIKIAPWKTDLLLAIKRIILVSFPASMSAAVSDMIK